MATRLASAWTTVVPILALLAVAATWQRSLNVVVVLIVAIVLIAAVLAAVHHADVVAHRVGEPFGSLVLAVAVTVIEVALIVTMMASGKSGADTLARDTVFAAVIITCNGIVGISLLLGSIRHDLPRFNPEGTGAALAFVATLTTITLVLPTFTVSNPGPRFTPPQLAFVAVAALVLYAAFVFNQTGRHREFYLPVTAAGDPGHTDEHRVRPSLKSTLFSLALLLVALVAVVGLAKAVSPAVEVAVETAGIPNSFVGVVIALLVLLPEALSAVKAARQNRIQTSLNLAFGSAMASIGLTIPVMAVLSIWLPGPLTLGLGPLQIVLLALTVVVATLTVIPGRATRLQGLVHLIIFASFVFLAASP